MKLPTVNDAKKEYGISQDVLISGGSILSDFPCVHYVSGIENIDELLNGTKYSNLNLDMMLESRENGLIIKVVRSIKSRIEFAIHDSKVLIVKAKSNNIITIREENLASDILSRGGFGLVGLVAGAIGKTVAGNKSIQKHGNIYEFKLNHEGNEGTFQLCAEDINIKKVNKFLSNHYKNKFITE